MENQYEKDQYKVNIIKQHIEAMGNDEYYFAQVVGNAGKPINLSKGALILLRQYYEGTLRVKED